MYITIYSSILSINTGSVLAVYCQYKISYCISTICLAVQKARIVLPRYCQYKSWQYYGQYTAKLQYTIDNTVRKGRRRHREAFLRLARSKRKALLRQIAHATVARGFRCVRRRRRAQEVRSKRSILHLDRSDD